MVLMCVLIDSKGRQSCLLNNLKAASPSDYPTKYYGTKYVWVGIVSKGIKWTNLFIKIS